MGDGVAGVVVRSLVPMVGLTRLRWGSLVGVVALLGCGAAVEVEDLGTDGGSSSTGVVDGTSTTDDIEPGSTTMSPSDTTDEVPPAPLLSSGTYFAALTPTPISGTTPFQFLAEVTVEGGSMSIALTHLSLDVLSTTAPREPVGETIEIDNIPLDASGSFAFALDLATPGAANPITGSDIEASLEFDGQVQDGRLCAAVGGRIVVPANIDLTGSTFAAILVEGPEARPDVATVVCE